MPPKNCVIIDTDPGCDDVLALLWALSSPVSELEVMLISVCFGNVDVLTCTRNVVTVFQILEKEMEWRRQRGLPEGFEGVTKYRPLVAMGAREALVGPNESADYFHGRDGLAGSHATHPQFTPGEEWRGLFEQVEGKEDYITEAARGQVDVSAPPTRGFRASSRVAHREILRLLRENEEGTITVIAVGPLTNLALAAAEDPETFLRAKEVVIMSGVVDGHGNVTPVAEFNVFADADAAAWVYALSSPSPASTMLGVLTETAHGVKLPPYPAKLSKQQRTIMLSLDITEYHRLSREDYLKIALPLAEQKSPLAEWMNAFMVPMLDKMERLGEGAAFQLHDPMCVYYVLTSDDPKWKASDKSPEDIRIETTGQWSRGMTVGDKRIRQRRNSDGDVPYDRGNWLGQTSGNRIYRMLESPGRDIAGRALMQSIFGGAT